MTLTLGLKLRKTDVPKAFTKAKLDVKMYVEHPEASKLPGVLRSKVDKNGQPYVALLSKALEGLKQSGNLFQSLVTRVLKEELGFKQVEMEPTIFVKHTSSFVLVILVWIDDYAVAYSSLEGIEWFLGSKTELNIKDEGDLKTFIGLEIDQTLTDLALARPQESKGLSASTSPKPQAYPVPNYQHFMIRRAGHPHPRIVF